MPQPADRKHRHQQTNGITRDELQRECRTCRVASSTGQPISRQAVRCPNNKSYTCLYPCTPAAGQSGNDPSRRVEHLARSSLRGTVKGPNEAQPRESRLTPRGLSRIIGETTPLRVRCRGRRPLHPLQPRPSHFHLPRFSKHEARNVWETNGADAGQPSSSLRSICFDLSGCWQRKQGAPALRFF